MTFKDALSLGRVSNLPTVWSNVLTGTVLAAGAIHAPSLALIALAMSFAYVGGMYLNDAFDREIDARERPERPIPSGRVGATTVFTIGFALLGASIATVAAVTLAWPALVSAAATAAVIVLYDAWHKGNPLSPFIMGLCRVGVYTTAALVVAPTLSGPVLAGAGALLAYLIGLTYTAKQENLASVGNLWPLLFLAAPFAYTAPALADGDPAFIALFVALAVWIVYSVRFLTLPTPQIPRAVVQLIAGISLLDALLVAHAGRPDLAPVALGAFALTLALQRWVRGT